MEQNMQYLMWMKSKQILNSQFQPSMNSFNTSSSSSWEEQAFAEDAAGPLGGFVWPPRSYSCTFCRREFRSAQALGGHMNVHRRDRARLKQSLCNDSPSLQQLPGTGSYGDHSPQGNDHSISGGSNSPNSRASAPVMSQENSSEDEPYVSPFPSTNITMEQHRRFPYSSSPDHSNSARLLSISSNSRTTPIGLSSWNPEDGVETNLSVGINPHNDEEMTINSKRLKSSSPSFPFYHKPCSSDRFPFHQEVLRMKTASSIDDIDLELRLGDAPAVK